MHRMSSVITWIQRKGFGWVLSDELLYLDDALEGRAQRHVIIILLPSAPLSQYVLAWEALGNPGWNWDNMLKYANKAETCVQF
jgi:hypothetical protein